MPLSKHIEDVRPNEGNLGRDMMALERTFLAWVRQAVMCCTVAGSLMSIFHLQLNVHSEPVIRAIKGVCSALAILSAAMALHAFERYYTSGQAIVEEHRFTYYTPAIFILGILVIIVSVVCLRALTGAARYSSVFIIGA